MQVLVKKLHEISSAVGLVKQKDMKAPPNHMGLIVDSLALFGASLL